jgi:transposase
VAPRDLGFESAYIFGAVCPERGTAAAIIMPRANTAAMNLHLEEIGAQVGSAAHAVLLVDGAAWHTTKALQVPDNITPLILPAYSPELNVVERIWHYLRSHFLSNRRFQDYAEVLDACEDAWNRFVAEPGLIKSLCQADWATIPEIK